MRLLPFQKHFLEKEKEEKTALTQDKLDAMQLNFFKRIKCLCNNEGYFLFGLLGGKEPDHVKV